MVSAQVDQMIVHNGQADGRKFQVVQALREGNDG
jgi:hypothetical protein